MTIYIGAGPSVTSQNAESLNTVELRVISNLLQSQAANQQQDDLRILRNDQAFELGINPATIPGN